MTHKCILIWNTTGVNFVTKIFKKVEKMLNESNNNGVVSEADSNDSLECFLYYVFLERDWRRGVS